MQHVLIWSQYQVLLATEHSNILLSGLPSIHMQHNSHPNVLCSVLLLLANLMCHVLEKVGL